MAGSLPSGTALPSRSDPAFERFARLVRRQLDVPVALVTLVSADEQVFPGAVGLPEPWRSTRRTPLSHSFCQHVVRSAAPLIVSDARTDPRVADNLAIPDLHVIAYAGVPITDADGAVVGSLCAIASRPRTWSDEDLAVLIDLADACSSELQLRTAQQRADQAAAQARRLLAQQQVDRSRWALALDAGQVGTFDLDLGTGALTVDDRLLELSGMDRVTFTGRPEDVYAHVHPDDVAEVVARVRKAVATGGTYQAEYRIVLADGSHRWIAARGQTVGGVDGTDPRLVGVVIDTTTQREPQEQTAQIVDEMAVGFIALDPDWVITHVNREAERITGQPREQLLGRTLWEAFPATVDTAFEKHYRRAADTGQPVSFDAYYPEPLDVWVEVRAVPRPAGVALHFVDITARAQAAQQFERAAARERLLGRITEELVGTLDADEAAERLSRLVVPAIADWCVVTIGDDDLAAGSRRGLRTAAAWHVDPAMRETTAAYAQARLGSLEDDAILIRAMRSGQLQLIDAGATGQVQDMLAGGPVQELMGALAPEAVAVLPLPGRNGPVGILSLANGAARGSFTPEDLVTARHIAARSGLVLDGARLYRQQRGLAEGFQRSLLTAPFEPDHLQVVVRYVPASQAAQVGGDWYDSFMQPGGATMLVIGDVAGHDVQAAAAMGQLRSIVRTVGALDHDGPAAVLRQVERVMETLQAPILATTVVARLEQTDPEKDAGLTRLRWSNAGHPPPMAVAPDGTVTVLTAERADLLLGVDPTAPRRESQVTLGWDTVVVLYTDGLIERRDADLDTGITRLQATLAELAGRDLDELCDELLARMLSDAPDDDVALVAVRLHRQDRPRPAEAGPNRVPPGFPVD
ncbi:SpoIIE family protein phosphatase [Geodermatophilus sabuli]|uniref:PAS domain S-box-containing protein n=1 Tax=Geodermatophilus sabuli TaxID=1564158 RepID=A0A285EG22_9ACTN|nr:SpoIIE family protein phosphatase [Geodermatophilus sabuli]MBB3084653.1 PAS domain S-box-containing protein [Geodermatophilus sabuli]SNX97154.1 PAS domain S-box-containing protein [Geodermatophilus sabuli]